MQLERDAGISLLSRLWVFVSPFLPIITPVRLEEGMLTRDVCPGGLCAYIGAGKLEDPYLHL